MQLIAGGSPSLLGECPEVVAGTADEQQRLLRHDEIYKYLYSTATVPRRGEAAPTALPSETLVNPIEPSYHPDMRMEDLVP